MVIPDDKNSRIIFIIPRDDTLLIGTTETDYQEDPMVDSMWFKHFLTSGAFLVNKALFLQSMQRRSQFICELISFGDFEMSDKSFSMKSGDFSNMIQHLSFFSFLRLKVELG